MTVVVARLPRVTLAEGTELHRIHRSDRDPWHFDSSSDGRFNPTHRPGWGASYWTEDPLGAFAEVFRTRLRLTDRDIDDRRLTTVTFEFPLDVVDLTKRAALGAGVTASIVHATDYAPAQSSASDLVDVCDGVRWRVRHDLQQSLIAIALFGRPGKQPRTRRQRASAISTELQDLAGSQCGYEVLPPVTP